jgi:hypothetical protein
MCTFDLLLGRTILPLHKFRIMFFSHDYFNIKIISCNTFKILCNKCLLKIILSINFSQYHLLCFIFIAMWIWCDWQPCLVSFRSSVLWWKEEGIKQFIYIFNDNSVRIMVFNATFNNI